MVLEKKPVVLVVDDSHSIRKEVKVILEREGYEVRTAGSQIGLMQQVDAYGKIVDVLLMDITLKKENGFELIEKMRTIDAYKHIPVFMLSQHRDPDNVMNAKKIGVNGYLLKPVQPKLLVERVASVLPENKRASAEEEKDSANEETEAANEETETGNEKTANEETANEETETSNEETETADTVLEDKLT